MIPRSCSLLLAGALALATAGSATANDGTATRCGVGETRPNQPCTLPLLDGGAVPVPFGTDVGFQSAMEGQPALGPDLVAASDDGRWALFDPVQRRVIGRFPGGAGPLALARVDDLSFSRDGSLLILDLSGRRLGRLSGADSWGGGGNPLRNASPRASGPSPRPAPAAPDSARLADSSAVVWVPLPGLAPSAGTLLVEGRSVGLVDPLGNVHPLAMLAGTDALEPLVRGEDRLRGGADIRLVRAGARAWVVVAGGKEGGAAEVEVPGDTLGVTAFGRWIVLDRGAPGKMTAREARHLDTGRSVALPLPREQRWRPSDGVGVTPGGSLVWIEATNGGAVLHRAAASAPPDGAGGPSGEALRRAPPPPQESRGDK